MARGRGTGKVYWGGQMGGSHAKALSVTPTKVRAGGGGGREKKSREIKRDEHIYERDRERV